MFFSARRLPAEASKNKKTIRTFNYFLWMLQNAVGLQQGHHLMAFGLEELEAIGCFVFLVLPRSMETLR